jgi:phage-related protein
VAPSALLSLAEGIRQLSCGGEGPGVLEIEDHAGNTFRVVYTIQFAEAVYVLHVFQKEIPEWDQDSHAMWN